MSQKILIFVIFPLFYLQDIVAQSSQNQNLFEAIKEGEIDKCKLLIAKGADVSFIDEHNKPVIIYAVSNGDAEIIELLIENRVDVNQLYEGMSPLFWTVAILNNGLVETLIKAGADINFQE